MIIYAMLGLYISLFKSTIDDRFKRLLWRLKFKQNEKQRYKD